MQQQPGGAAAPLYNNTSMKHNFEVLSFNRIFASLVAGCATGVAGVTGYRGFLLYLLSHAGLAGLMLLKTGLQPRKFFSSWTTVALGGFLSSTELLTFILFWTLTNNFVYLF